PVRSVRLDVALGDREVAQRGGEQLAAAEQPAHHRADRRLHDVCDLLVRQALNVAQHHRGAEVVGQAVERALDSLPDDFRTAVVLCDVQGLSYKEIADIMETPVGTVMSRLFRGRKLLAAALRDFAISEGYVKPDGPDRVDRPD